MYVTVLNKYTETNKKRGKKERQLASSIFTPRVNVFLNHTSATNYSR